MGAFDYRQAQEVRDAFARHNVHYLFIANPARFFWAFPTRLRMHTCSC
jgi:hypothetical protein